MIVYFDASALAKRYVAEEGSAEVLHWLEESTSAVCRLSEAEVASALSRRCREGVISLADRDRALTALDADLEAVHVVEPTQEVFQAARGALLRHSLRAADALQLASAIVLRERLQTRIAFLTFDDRLAAASELEGLASPATI